MKIVILVFVFYIQSVLASTCTDINSDSDLCFATPGCKFVSGLCDDTPVLDCDQQTNEDDCKYTVSDCTWFTNTNSCSRQGHPTSTQCASIGDQSTCESLSCMWVGSSCIPINCAQVWPNSCANTKGCYETVNGCKQVPIGPCNTITTQEQCLSSGFSACEWNLSDGICYEFNQFPFCSIYGVAFCGTTRPCTWSNSVCHAMGSINLPYWASPTYTVPYVSFPGPGDSFSWQYLGVSPCSDACGGGVRYNTYQCVNNGNEIRADVDCDGLPFPNGPQIETCNTYACSGCAQYSSDQTACTTNNCFWDDFTPSINPSYGTPIPSACYNGISHSNQINGGCIVWTGISGNACQLHGCEYTNIFDSTGLCISTTGTSSDDPSTGILRATAAFSKGEILRNTLSFNYAIYAPITWSFTRPLWGIVGIGPQYTTTNPSDINPNSYCNGLPSGFTSVPQPIVGYTNTIDYLKTYCKDYVDMYHNLNFPNGIDGDACRAMLGGVDVGGGSIMSSVSFIDINNIMYNITVDLPTVVNNCRDTHVTIYPTYTLYQIPRTYTIRTIQDDLAQVLERTNIVVDIYGSITITASSTNPIIARPTDVHSTSSCSTPGEQRLNSTIILEYRGATNSSIKIGPRSISDVYTTYYSDTGCYGDSVLRLQSQPYNSVSKTWEYYIYVTSVCTSINPDGNTFMNCIQGSGVPEMHPLWVNTQCCVGDMCTDCNASPNGDYDLLNLRYTTNAYPDNDINHSFRVSGGLLPTPISNLSEGKILGTDNPFYVNVSESRNQQLRWDKTLTYFIILDEEIRSTYQLDLINDFTFTPLSANGDQIYTSPVLDYTVLSPFLSYVTRNGAVDNGLTIPACNTIIGCDGFAVPVIYLKDKSPASGYRVNINYRITLPTTHGRRLLQVTSGVIDYGILQVVIFINGTNYDISLYNSTGELTQYNANYPKVLDIDLGNPDFLIFVSYLITIFGSMLFICIISMILHYFKGL
jgi:hypothetical protein